MEKKKKKKKIKIKIKKIATCRPAAAGKNILGTKGCATLYIAQRLLFRLNRGWMFSAVVRDCALKSVVTSKSS